MTKQGIEYLRGIYSNAVRSGREYAEGRMAGHMGAAMMESRCNGERDLIEAIAQLERFNLPVHEEIFKEAPHGSDHA